MPATRLRGQSAAMVFGGVIPKRLPFLKETDGPGVGQSANQHISANTGECIEIAGGGHELLL